MEQAGRRGNGGTAYLRTAMFLILGVHDGEKIRSQGVPGKKNEDKIIGYVARVSPLAVP